MSCGQEKQAKKAQDNNSTVSETLNDDIFRIIMDINIAENDRLQLFYKDSEQDESFSVEKRIVKRIKGNEGFQTVTFELPPKNLPYAFRIDLGEMSNETSIIVNEIRIELNSSELVINNKTLNRFFTKNLYLETDDNRVFLRKKINGRYDPFLISTPFLIKKIELEF